MLNRFYREYKFKFYLNSAHSILIDGHQGAVHPHTWEFSLKILIQREGFVEFNVFEKAINLFFEKYQNQTLNQVKPFDTIMPTLENMVDYFGQELRPIIQAVGGELMEIEGSETPTRSYLASYMNDGLFIEDVNVNTQNTVSRIMDRLMDEIEDESRKKR